jgi:hypothetical protein
MTKTTATMGMILGSMLLAACGGGKDAGGKQAGGIAPQKMTDGLYAVLAADRAVYTQQVVNRLAELKVLKATEHFEDDKTLPLPAQMFRMGSESVQKGNHGFSYALLSTWPINKQNAPVTAFEKQGLAEVEKTGKNVYGEETLAGKRYFTAIYPDKAISQACVTCHNDNADSPRSDFKLDEVMGGVVIRVAL